MKRYLSLILLILLAPVAAIGHCGNLKIGSWNLQYFNSENYVSLHPMSTRPRTNTERKEYADIVSRINADIFAFQEVGDLRALELFAKDYDLFISEQATGDLENKNNLIHNGFLIRRPLSDKVLNVFTLKDSVITYEEKNSETGQMIERTSRAFIGVNLLIKEHFLVVLNVHLKHGCKSRVLGGSGCRVVSSQLEEVSNFIKETFSNHPQAQIILVGDMNLRLTSNDPRREQWAEFTRRLVDITQDLAIRRWPEFTSPTCQTQKRTEFIDYFVCITNKDSLCAGRSFREYKYDDDSINWGLQLSDHCPISLEFKVR